MTKFKGKIKLGPNDIAHNEVYAEIDKSEFDLSYDDVIDAFYEEMEKKYPAEYYPFADIVEIFIKKLEDDGYEYEYPVVPESKSDIDKYKQEYKKILILPENIYSLTPEMKLYMNMLKRGLIDEDHDFDFDEMHEILKDLGLNKDND